MKFILCAGPACTMCECCEEWVPGFVSMYGGRQIVCRRSDDIEELMLTAKACCPQECIYFREIE